MVLLATKLEPTKQAFQLSADTAAAAGYTSGTQNVSYLLKVHVDETEVGRGLVGRGEREQHRHMVTAEVTRPHPCFAAGIGVAWSGRV